MEPPMNDDQVRRTLLIETHWCIENAANETMAKIGRRRTRSIPERGRIDPEAVMADPIDPEALLLAYPIDTEALVAYPPTDPVLTNEEDEALRSMTLSSVERSALTKLIANGCAAAFFHFFNLIDGTGDPEVNPPEETWLGAWIVAPRDDRDREMLHDGFYEAYHEYQNAG
jgi:hypothetical protein